MGQQESKTSPQGIAYKDGVLSMPHKSPLVMEDVLELVKELSENPKYENVTELDLTNKWMAPDAAEPLMIFLQTNTSITRMDVGNSSLYKGVGEMLAKNRSITDLNLRSNTLGSKGLGTLIETGLLKNASLKSLDLESNNIRELDSSYGSHSGSNENLTTYLTVNQSLLSLNLATNFLGDASITSIMKVLISRNFTLKAINLASSNLSVQGCESIGEMLSKNKSLTYLDLAANRFGDQGLAKITAGLKKNTSLKYLGLRETDLITMPGLAEVLKENNTLDTLVLSVNNIWEYLDPVIVSLSYNTGLERLIISSCWTNNNHCMSIANMLAKNKTLKEIDLGDNQGITSFGGDSLIEALTNKNTTLVDLYIYHSSFPRAKIQQIENLTRKNQKRLEEKSEKKK